MHQHLSLGDTGWSGYVGRVVWNPDSSDIPAFHVNYAQRHETRCIETNSTEKLHLPNGRRLCEPQKYDKRIPG